MRHRLSAGRAAVVVIATAIALAASPTVGSVGAATLSAPTYVRTIGVPGHSEMYPSGLDVDGAGNVAVADTGNDRISFYPAGSTTASWRVGARGNPVGGTPTGFQNPRDVAVGATRVYVADTDDNVVQVLAKSDGHFIGKIPFAFSTPIGISLGTDGARHKRILVSNGGTGTIDVFDASFAHVRTIRPVTANSGTRDAATDSNGNIYVADYRGDQIVKYSPTGTVLKRWGGPGAPACKQVPRPYGVDVDAANHVYVASSNLEQVKEFTSAGACIRTFGTKGTGGNQLLQLRRVAVGRGTNPLVYAADLWGLKILTYHQDGSLNALELGSGTYPAAGGLNEPNGVAVSATHVYVTDTVNQRVQRFDLDGSNPIMWGGKGVAESTASFNWAQGIGFDPDSGNVWVANTRNNRLDEFGPSGTGPLRLLGHRTGGAPNFYWPMDVVFAPNGHMFVADTYNHRIQAFSVTSTSIAQLWVTGRFGSGTGEFNRPFSLTYDDSGATPRLLVADTRNSRIVALNASTGGWQGVLPIAKGSAAGKVSGPRGIAAAPDGSFWVSDTGNDRIERFAADGSFTGEIVGSKGNGTNQFNFPQRMRIAGGLLYVADAYNDRIQVFQP